MKIRGCSQNCTCTEISSYCKQLEGVETFTVFYEIS
jgi:hypothetical protein